MIQASQMYARNTSGIGTLPQFLRDMDKAEDRQIANDNQKLYRLKKFTNSDIQEISRGSALIAVISAVSFALISPQDALVAGLSGAALGAGAIALSTAHTNYFKAAYEVTTDRMVRLNRKIRFMRARIPNLNQEEANKANLAIFYFQKSIDQAAARFVII